MRPRPTRSTRILALVVAVALIALGAVAGTVWLRGHASAAAGGASLTIVLDAHDPQAFAFATDGTGLDDFTLDHDNDPARPDRITFTDLDDGGYTVTQAAVVGWELSSLGCSSPQNTDRDARRVRVTLEGGDAVTCTFTNAPTRPLVGATRWDAWHDGDIGQKVEYILGPEKWRNRLPWFGEVTGPDTVIARADNQAVADAEIATAAGLGIDYFAFVWYGAGYPAGSDQEALGRGLTYYRSSEARDRVKYTLEARTSLVADPDQRAAILEYMRDPNWVHVDGRPLLFVGMGEAPDAAAFAALRSESKAQGAGNPYLVYLCLGSYKLADAPTYVAQGADAVTAYAMGVATATGAPYATLATQTHATWDSTAATGAPVVPTVMAGWDPRPRLERPPSWGTSGSSWYAGATPAELGTHLTDGIQWAQGAGAKAVLAYAWNEFDEGGWLDRMYLDDPDRQAAIRAGIAAGATAPSLSAERATVTEGDAGATEAVVKVRLANPPNATVTVDYTTVDASAVAPGDYTATKGTLTFAPGATVGKITVPVAGDTTFENEETFAVRLSRPVNAFLGPAATTVVITNDDAAVALRKTFVSDLTPTASTNGSGPVERDTSNGGKAAGDGRTITLNGVTYDKGLGVHSASSVTYTVPAGAASFTADIGVDDECGKSGSVVFQVLVDGVAKFTSAKLVPTSPTRTATVDVTGATSLVLKVTNAGDGSSCDHADWAGARLLAAEGTEAPPSTAPSTSTTARATTATTSTGGTTWFASDLTAVSVTSGYGPMERDMSNGGQAAGDGQTITLNGVRFPKGLGVHAASSVVYTVPAGATTFGADVGVDDECGARGSVVFQVLVDGAIKYTSPTLSASSTTPSVKVAVTGGQRVTLKVTDAGDGNGCDHADWAGARFL